jgi:hypothetical protein
MASTNKEAVGVAQRIVALDAHYNSVRPTLTQQYSMFQSSISFKLPLFSLSSSSISSFFFPLFLLSSISFFSFPLSSLSFFSFSSLSSFLYLLYLSLSSSFTSLLFLVFRTSLCQTSEPTPPRECSLSTGHDHQTNLPAASITIIS